MHKDLAGGSKRKNECEWAYKDVTVAKTIMTAAKAAIFIYMKYLDPFDGVTKTITVYTGDITATAQNAYGETLFEVRLNFIEQ